MAEPFDDVALREYRRRRRRERGLLRTLRHARGTVSAGRILPDWPDASQRERAIASLVADGLAERDGDGLRLPS